MEIPQDAVSAYRLANGRKLMVLTKSRNSTPQLDDFCRIRAVETLAPGLWISATFLDGSIQRFRPEKIRVATEEEQQIAQALPTV